MKSEHHLCTETQVALEERIIRVDVPSVHAGITAALRRAFAPMDDDCRDRDFDELLRRLN